MGGVVARGFLPFSPLWVVSHAVTLGELAEQVGVSHRSVVRWKRTGVPVNSADRVACQLGLNPTTIWGSAWEGISWL